MGRVLRACRRLVRRLGFLVSRDRREAELAEEMAFHRDQVRQALEADGLPPVDADLASQRAFGSGPLAMNRARDVWVAAWLQDISQDIRFAARTLVKDRRFTLAAVAALALGIGVNASVFTVIHGALLDDMPFDEGDRLVAVDMLNAQGRDQGIPYLDLRDYADAARAFDGLAASASGMVTISGEAEPAERFRGAYVSATTFGLLRVPPLVGRDFLHDDDRPGAEPVVILGHGAWMRRYGGDPAVVGRAIRVNGRPAVVVGVMPPDFRFPFIAEAWQPLVHAPGIAVAERGERPVSVVGRLARDADVARARGEIETVAARLARVFPATHANLRARVRPLRDQRPDTSPMLLTMMGAVGFVLLVACANLAALLLARSAARAREIAIRASIGATRFRIVRQLLVECLLLSALAAAIGLPLSRVGVEQVAAGFDVIEPGAAPGSTRPYWYDFSLDVWPVVFVVGLCLATTLAIGLLPALMATRASTYGTLTTRTRPGMLGRGGRRLSDGLLAAELALTLVLLTGAGLLWRNFVELYRADPVVHSTGLVTGQIALPTSRYPSRVERERLIEAMDARLQALPGAIDAAVAGQRPLVAFPNADRLVRLPGDVAPDPGAKSRAALITVGESYFATLGLQPIRGRGLGAQDAQVGTEGVAVNQRFVDVFLDGRDPIGTRVQLLPVDSLGSDTPWLTIVGVVPTVPRLTRLSEPPDAVVYMPWQIDPPANVVILLRASGGVGTAAAALRQAVAAIDPDLPVFGIESLDTAIDRTRMGVRMVGTWFGVLALIALVVAGVGLAAITAHGVVQRTQEIGIRVALGARRSDVLWLFLRRTLVLLTIGLSLGLMGALAIGQLLMGYIVRTSPRDPLTLAVVTASLATVALAASLLPVRRATRIDPALTLRAD
jgi:putative ABC transport system permease protein